MTIYSQKNQYVLKNIFEGGGWLYPWIMKKMIEDESFLSYMSKQKPSVIHYLAMICIYEKYIDNKEIYSSGRPTLLEKIIPGSPGGIHKIVKKLSLPLWSRENYIELVELSKNSHCRKYLTHSKNISEYTISNLSQIDTKLYQFPIIYKIKSIDNIFQLLYYLKIFEKEFNKDLQKEIYRSLKKLNEVKTINRWIYRWFKKIEYKKPLWIGEPGFKYINKIKEIRLLAKEYENHIDSCIPELISGEMRILEFKDKTTRTLIKLERDPWLGWCISEMKGLNSQKLDISHKKKILNILKEHGLIYRHIRADCISEVTNIFEISEMFAKEYPDGIR